MPWTRKRSLGFFPGLAVGLALGLGAGAAFGSQLHDGARSLQQEELRWRARAIEITSHAGSQAEEFLAQAESGLWAQLGSLTEGIIEGENGSLED